MSMYTLLAIVLIHECVGDGREDRLAVRTGETQPALRVTSIPTSPYLILKSSTDGREFEGFIPDLLDAVSRRLDLRYTIIEVPDGRYGAQLPNGTWNGMIGELLRGKADLAAAPLVVTSSRMRVVDFTHPFIGHGQYVAAIIKKRHSTKAGIYSLKDLVHQSTIKYSVLEGGSMTEKFRTSSDPDYQLMWAAMSFNTDSFVRTIEEGVERVIGSSDEHPWAFIAESITLEYYAGRRCDLEVIVDLYSPLNGYALALPIGSPYYDRINLAVVEMIELGRMTLLLRKWLPSTDCRHSATSAASRLVSPLHAFKREL